MIRFFSHSVTPDRLFVLDEFLEVSSSIVRCEWVIEPYRGTMDAEFVVSPLRSSKELSTARMKELEKCNIEGKAGSSREMG